MTDDSELESLQCYPFHLPVTLGDNTRPTVSRDLSPYEVRALYQGEWNAGNDAEVVEELLEAAGVPVYGSQERYDDLMFRALAFELGLTHDELLERLRDKANGTD